MQEVIDAIRRGFNTAEEIGNDLDVSASAVMYHLDAPWMIGVVEPRLVRPRRLSDNHPFSIYTKYDLLEDPDPECSEAEPNMKIEISIPIWKGNNYICENCRFWDDGICRAGGVKRILLERSGRQLETDPDDVCGDWMKNE